ncbi:hypothetical protein Tco_0309540 [Tanacetum coccineum]
MGRDTIQLEDTVSTISGEYLLEFTSWIFPTVVAWRTSAPKDGMPPADSYPSVDVTTLNTRQIDLFNLISTPNPLKVKTGIRPHAAHEVSLLTVTANRVIEIEETGVASQSSGTPSALEKSPLDFSNEDPPQTITERVGTGGQVQDELSWEIPSVGRATTAEVVPETGECAAQGVEERSCVQPAHSAYGGKSLAAMGLGAGFISSTPSAQGTPTAAKSVSDQILCRT